jgi:hypothetical protein
MKQTIGAVKALLLVLSVAIIGSSVISDPGYAREAWCEDEGHSCHVIYEGQTYHLKNVE